MTLRTWRSLIIITGLLPGMLLSGCQKEKQTITAEPSKPTDRRTVPTTSASSDRPKKPSLSQPRDHQLESKEAQQTAPTQHADQTAKLSPSKSGPDVRKQAESATPLNQSESETDLDITQRIRQALMREDLSFEAKNVLVITEADHVVLKGQVRSPAEAERVKGIAGTITTKRIEDVLEVSH